MIKTVMDTNILVAALKNKKRWKKLKTFRGIRIVSPSKFYEILKKRKP